MVTAVAAGGEDPRPLFNGRSEGEVLARSGIPVVMGEATYWLRPLTIDGAEEWERRIRGVLSALLGGLASAGGGIDGVLGVYRGTVEAGLDALYAYQEIGGFPALPTRVVLRASASRNDLDEAIRKLVKHEFPLLKGMDFLNAWVPAEVRTIITTHLLQLLPDGSPSEPSLKSSSQITPGPDKPKANRAQRRSARP